MEMEVSIWYSEKSTTTQTVVNKLEIEALTLKNGLEEHLGNKVKVSFLPNQYYNDKIYTLAGYLVTQDQEGLTINMELKEGSVTVNYKIENVVSVEEQVFFNRTEYKANVGSLDICRETYNFCLYF